MISRFLIRHHSSDPFLLVVIILSLSDELPLRMTQRFGTNFDVLLTMHLSIVLVINQPNAQNLVLL